MRARCGRCRTEFDVLRPGRYACPGCGATNEVRGGQPDSPGARPPSDARRAGPSSPLASASPPPEKPSRRTRCSDKRCGFSFIVGDIAVARCPMCGAEVNTRARFR